MAAILLLSGQSVATLSSVSATGAGTTIALPTQLGEIALRRITWEIVIKNNGGGLTAQTTNLEGSLDGTTWYTLDSSSSTVSELRHVVDKVVRFVRGNLATYTPSSGSPQITVNLFEA